MLTTATGGRLALSAVALKKGEFSVDAEKGVITGLTVIAAGPAIGHGFYIDDTMLRQVAQQINAAGGVKSRLSHPGILSDGTGKAIGRVKNARVEGGKVRADLHLANFSAKSPAGNLRDYVLSVADEDPSALGMSIVFESAPLDEAEDGRLLGRVKEIFASDLVDDPAASPEGMLGNSIVPMSGQYPAKEGTTMNPRLRKYLESIGLGTNATEAEAQAFLAALNGAQRAEADKLAKGGEGDPPAPSVVPTPTPAPAPTPLTSAVDHEALRREATELERTRTREITALARELDLGDEWATKHINSGTALATAKDEAIKELRATKTGVPVTVGADRNIASLGAGISDAIRLRSGVKVEKPTERAREFRGMSMLEIGRAYLTTIGLSVMGLSKSDIAALMLNPLLLTEKLGGRVSLWQGAGSFTNIMADALGKTLRSAYEEAPKTWSQWARRATTSDFKPVKRTALSESPDLVAISVNGEVKYVQLSDAQETYALDEFGNIIAVTRRAIINDDMDAFRRIPQLQGAAAARKEEDVAYAVLTTNGNMADGVALFHSGHGNLAGSAAALSVTSLGAARTAMRKQKGIKGAARLDLAPRHLLVPAAIETVAEQLIGSIVDPTKNNSTPNPFANKLNVIANSRLDDNSATAWYLAADTNQVDTVEVCFLDDEQGPQFGQEMDFDTDGVKYKVRHSVVAAAIDYRGLFKNAGA